MLSRTLRYTFFDEAETILMHHVKVFDRQAMSIILSQIEVIQPMGHHILMRWWYVRPESAEDEIRIVNTNHHRLGYITRL